MSKQVESLVLEYLRAMRSDIATIKLDLGDLKLRMTSLETHVTDLFGDVLRQNASLDRITPA